MAHGTVITTTSPLHLSPGTVITCAGELGEAKHYYVLGRKSETELIVAHSWRDSLWVPWFIVSGWLLGKWSAARNWFLHQWDKWHPEEDILLSDDRVFVNDDSEPDLDRLN